MNGLVSMVNVFLRLLFIATVALARWSGQQWGKAAAIHRQNKLDEQRRKQNLNKH